MELSGEVGSVDHRGAAAGRCPVARSAERGELDRWLLSEMNRTLADVTGRMDEYDNYGACQQINQFVDDLSNWYVRRSRRPVLEQ